MVTIPEWKKNLNLAILTPEKRLDYLLLTSQDADCPAAVRTCLVISTSLKDPCRFLRAVDSGIPVPKTPTSLHDFTELGAWIFDHCFEFPQDLRESMLAGLIVVTVWPKLAQNIIDPTPIKAPILQEWLVHHHGGMSAIRALALSLNNKSKIRWYSTAIVEKFETAYPEVLKEMETWEC